MASGSIVVASYSGYKGLDFYSLYSVDFLGMDEVGAARFMSNASYLRVFAAIIAGLLVDRFSATKIIGSTFMLLLFSYILLIILSPVPGTIILIYGNLIFTFAAVYALRGVYFALLEETNIDKILTGTAVGLISVIGFTPDVFINSVAGRILDASPNLAGYHNFFMLLAGFAVAGLLASRLKPVWQSVMGQEDGRNSSVYHLVKYYTDCFVSSRKHAKSFSDFDFYTKLVLS